MMNRFGQQGGMEQQPQAQMGRPQPGMGMQGMGMQSTPNSPGMGPQSAPGPPQVPGMPPGGGMQGGAPQGGGMPGGFSPFMSQQQNIFNQRNDIRDLERQLLGMQMSGADPRQIAELQQQIGWANQDFQRQGQEQMFEAANRAGNRPPGVGGGPGAMGADNYMSQMLGIQYGMGNPLSKYGR